MSAQDNGRPYERWRWTMCVAIAAAPLALFVVAVWVFMGSDRQLLSVSRMAGNLSTDLIAHAVARVDMAILDYSMYAYVHVIVSLAAMTYFLVVMLSHARARKIRISREIGIAVSLALVVCLAIGIMTIKDLLPFATLPPVFSGLYVEPYLEPMKCLLGTLRPEEELSGRSWEPLGFLYVSVLGPAFAGVFAVVFCTSTFHHIVCSRRSTETERRDDIERCVTVLKRQLTVLSLVLVSSVVVTRAYVDLLPSALDPDTSGYKVYMELASSLTFAGSMLFTATLFAAFAPGVVVLLRGLTHLSSDEKSAILERLNPRRFAGKFTGTVQAVLTLAAPALAGALLDLPRLLLSLQT